MPTSKSAKKRMRTAHEAEQRNKPVKIDIQETPLF